MDKVETRNTEDETPPLTEVMDNTTQPCNTPQGPYSKKVDELEALLQNLQRKLSDAVAHIDYVKRIREELCATAQTLQKSTENCGDDCTKKEEEREKKLKDVLFEIKTRGQVLKILEKKELLLSHAILSVVSNWADEMEKSLGSKSLQTEEKGYRESNRSVEEDHVDRLSNCAIIYKNQSNLEH